MAPKPVRAAIGEMRITCQVCGSDRWRCGFVHLFVNRDLKLYRADK
ncbi:hypothetical protein SUDANB51_04116 [Streptomyces sp. enrichment culture]